MISAPGWGLAALSGALAGAGKVTALDVVADQVQGARVVGERVFEMYYQMGNFVPWREPAWALLAERVGVLSSRCADEAGRQGAPDGVAAAADAAAAICAQLAAHVPDELRPAQVRETARRIAELHSGPDGGSPPAT